MFKRDLSSISRRVRLEVDEQVLRDNFAIVKEHTAGCRVLTVLKANAYGCGADRLGPLVVKAGTDRIGVADLHEALAMQKAVNNAVPVQILGVVTPEELPYAVENDLVLPVNGLAMARRISAEAGRQNKVVRVHAILDTGMGRFGLLEDNYLEEIKLIRKLPNLQLEGIYSHFPQAGVAGDAGTLGQIEMFKKALTVLEKEGVSFDLRHIAASDGIQCQKPAISAPFNLVRLGLCWYGLSRAENGLPFQLGQSLKLTTTVGAVRRMPAGSNIGYMRSCMLKRDSMVATICAGYADGLPLALSNAGRVLINGCSCPVLGRVSMDYTMVDVTDVPGTVEWGTPVTLLGCDGKENIEFSEYAKLKNTHIHDILCALGSRVERVYC